MLLVHPFIWIDFKVSQRHDTVHDHLFHNGLVSLEVYTGEVECVNLYRIQNYLLVFVETALDMDHTRR